MSDMGKEIYRDKDKAITDRPPSQPMITIHKGSPPILIGLRNDPRG